MNYKSNLKEFKELSFAKSVLYNLVLSCFFTLILAIIVINIFNIRLDVVLSDSMANTILTGDIVVVVEQDEYKKGDIIEYKKGDIYVTHRILDYNEETGLYITKGDNNGSADSKEGNLQEKDIQGKVVAIWKQGKNVVDTVKNSYLLILAIVFGAWVLSSTLSGEAEIKKHNILNV